MLTLWEAIILGVVQGLTEFLPVSSSAHIVIASKLLGVQFSGLAFEVFLHFASLLAVVIFFWQDIMNILVGFFRYLTKRRSEDLVMFRFGILILIATFITGFFGIILEKSMGTALKSSSMIAVSLFVTGFLLIAVERFHHYGNRREAEMTYKDALIIGLAQTIAVIPGISRSGATLVAALFSGLARETAIRYSFILSIPVILGSSLLYIPDLGADFFRAQPLELSLAFIASFFSAIIGIKTLIYFVQKSKLTIFAGYVFIVGIFTFFYV